MYKFLYNKTCDLIGAIIFWAQAIAAIFVVLGIICLGFNTANVVWIIATEIWWGLQVFEGCFYFYQRSVVTLPDPDWLLYSEGVETKDVIQRFRNTAISAKQDNFLYVGTMKVLFGVAMFVCMLI